jgi:hypothetical protein
MLQACKAHLDATRALTPALAALPPEISRVVVKMLQNDIDLLSVAVIQSRALFAETDHTAPDLREGVEGLRAIIAQLLRMKVEALSPVAFGEAGMAKSDDHAR